MPAAFSLFVVAVLLFAPVRATANDTLSLFAGTHIGFSVTSPAAGSTAFDVSAGGDLSLCRCGVLGEEGYYSFASRFQAAIHNDLVFSDEESVSLKLSFRRSVFEAAMLASLIDDGSGATYFNPSWKMSTELVSLSNDGVVSLKYGGYVAWLPGVPDDHFYEGIHAVYRIDPSITLGYELAAGGSWEYYYEQPVYVLPGEPGGADRHDLILDVTGGVDGFAGYFTEWAVSGGVSWRISNATFPVDAAEDRLTAAIEATLFTSPHRSWTIEGAFSAEGIRYFSRPARSSAGVYGEDKLLFLEMSASARTEWSPDQRTYVSLDGSFGYSLSNDPFLGGWYAKGVLALTL